MRIKGFYCLILIFIAAITSALVGLFTFRKSVRLRRSALIVSWLSKRLLNTLNVTVHETKIASNPGTLIVANHVSFLDILVIAAHRPAIFITSVEKEEMAVVGYLARLGGSIFVERRHRNRIRSDQAQVSKILGENHDVVLFPEGTSGDGRELLPFKKGLFPAAIDIGADIQPLAILYSQVNGHALDEESRPKLFFYGDFGVWKHLRFLLSFNSIVCEMKWLPPVKIDASSTREKIGEEVSKIRDSIDSALHAEVFDQFREMQSTSCRSSL